MSELVELRILQKWTWPQHDGTPFTLTLSLGSTLANEKQYIALLDGLPLMNTEWCTTTVERRTEPVWVPADE